MGAIIERRENPYVEVEYVCPNDHNFKVFQPRDKIPQTTQCERHQEIAKLFKPESFIDINRNLHIIITND